MNKERNPWDQMEGESLKWFSRFDKFRLMKPWERSIVDVFLLEDTEKNREKPRKKPTGDWYEIAKQWKWEERAKAWDAYRIAEEDRVIAEERSKILRSGLALMHERVKELDKLTHKLIKMADDESKIWIPETRTFGTGEDKTSTVEKLEFNAPLFTLIDKYLASIAAEMGERVKKKEISITELPANVYLNFDPDQDGVDT